MMMFYLIAGFFVLASTWRYFRNAHRRQAGRGKHGMVYRPLAVIPPNKETL